MTYQAEVLADSPVGYWRLDEIGFADYNPGSGGTAADSSGSALDGTYPNLCSITIGRSPLIDNGHAAYLDGSSAHVAVAANAAFNAGGIICVEAIVEGPARGISQSVFTSDGSPNYFELALDSAGKVIFAWYDSGGGGHFSIGTTDCADGARHHIVAMYDDSSQNTLVYVDGSLEVNDSWAGASTLRTTNDGLRIGLARRIGAPGRYLGKIDEVAIYTSLLSGGRVAAHFASMGTEPAPGPAAPAPTGTLYASRAGGFTTANLYTVDPSTGAMTSVGPTGFALTGLAFDPTTGTLYGATSNTSSANPKSLVTVDPATGAGTLVAAWSGGGITFPLSDICFDSTGQGYGWAQHGQLVRFDKATGVCTAVGAASGEAFGGAGMSIDSLDDLYVLFNSDADARSLYLVDKTSGARTLLQTDMDDSRAAAFSSDDFLYSVDSDSSPEDLTWLDFDAGGCIVDEGPMSSGTDALAWSVSPTPPPPSSPVLIAEPPWRLVVADVVFNGSSPPGFSTLTFLDHRAINRQVRYYLRQAATFGGRVAADDPEINILSTDGEPFLAEGVRMLIGLRREGGNPPWVPRFAGPILQASRLVENDVPWVDFTAYGVRQLLYKRPVRDGNGLLLGRNGLTFKGVQGNTILLALLERTFVADGWHFIDTTTGTIEDTDEIWINFQQGSSVGEALDQLEQTGTMDILLPAVYDPVDSPGFLAQLNLHVRAGSVQHAAIMSWDMAGRTLDGINWLEDGQQRENNVELYTADSRPTPIQTDAPSIAEFGSYWGQQNYPVQTQLPAITAAAATRLQKNKDHPETLELSPIPRLAPIPLLEYGLADWLPTYASKRLGKKVNGSYRVYELGLDLPDDSGETAHLLVSANLEPLA